MKNMTSADIILAEDERVIRQAITDLLEDAHFSVRAACNGEEALALYREQRPDLMILDVMMPKKDGFSVCREIRENDPLTSVIFLTQLDAERSELEGLKAGGDTYIPKTVSREVLLARIQASLRRRTRPDDEEFYFASWRVNPAMKTITSADGASCVISKREAALLRLFALYPGEVFSRDFLLEKFWGPKYEGSDSPLTVAIMRLREKLDADGVKITSVRACGYAYDPRA